MTVVTIAATARIAVPRFDTVSHLLVTDAS